MPAIIVKRYEHFNTAFKNWDTPKGVYVKNKDHYDRLMKENGMVSYDEMKSRTEANARRDKKYEPSKQALSIVKHAIEKADKKGNVKLDGMAIDALKKMKALKPKLPNYVKVPNGATKGGFNGK